VGALAVRDRQMILIDRARQALAEAASLKQVKAVLDAAAAAELYAKRQQLSDEVVGHAHSLRIDSLAKLGTMLSQMPKHHGGRPSKTRSGLEQVSTLASLGIDRKTSMMAQRLAELPVAMRRQVAARRCTLWTAVLAHRRASTSTPKLPRGKYRVILADPPWPASKDRRPTDYPTMTLDAMQALPVCDLAADDAVMFMWVVPCMLPHCFELMRAWGFEYRSQFVWDKVQGLFGPYSSVQHENLLLAVRGSCLPDRRLPLVPSVTRVRKPRRHSEKPADFHRMIERLYDGPRIELFARQRRRGWASWGNEVSVAA
jgi:N6-adenosine-specific RNA methylase IME4